LSDALVISIDAMGGDHGPSVVIPGVDRTVRDGLDARFLLHGDTAQLHSALARFPQLADRCEIRHADRVIGGNEKPAQAMRRGKGASMWNAIESLRADEAQACVSAGNTGALMAIAMLMLRMMAGMERPALVAAWPTLRGDTAVLDVGANISCDAQRLVEFAIMGAAFHHAVHGSARPNVGLLNVGSEDEKGHEELREASRLLREMTLEFDYRGFVEGDDIAKGTVDVVVTDGFTGNVALKTAEGVGRFVRAEMRRAFASGPFARAGALLASAALRRLAERFDPSGINAAPFLGLNGIVVKSHGGADARGFSTAIRLAANLARSDFVAQIDHNLTKFTAAMRENAGEVGERRDA
jgi:glycerol-3-phosphate acyltransferase PlsX